MSLHEEPKKDGFTHETPIRAFTTFHVEGIYAIGKGFRPSLQHLVPYLDAMERKEGWRLVQTLEAGSQTPSFIFRQERRPVISMTTGDIDPKNLEMAFTGHPGDWSAKAVLRDPVMPEVRAKFGDQRDYGDEDPSCDDNAGLAPDHVTVPGPAPFDQTPERIVRVPQGIGAPYQAPKDWTAIQNGDIYETMAAAVLKDDPVNPKHYGGTACAEIGELLTANSYQVLKYNWRLGEKDDEKVELGKAIWYLDREIVLADTIMIPARMLPEYGWFDERLRHATPHAQAVARILISWNRHRNIHSLKGLRKQLKRTLRELEAKAGATLDMGRGMEP